MTYLPAAVQDHNLILPKLPNWATFRTVGTPENVTFLSGTVFTTLDLILGQYGEAVPQKLLANKLALQAALVTSKIEGRLAREQDIRDAFYLTQPGDARGPDGDLLFFWRASVNIGLRREDWAQKILDLADEHLADQLTRILEQSLKRGCSHGPLSAAVSALTEILALDDRAERTACMVTDAVIAKTLNWDRPWPITALNLTKSKMRALKAGSSEAETSIQISVCQGVQNTILLAVELARCASALRSFATKLRAKGADAAITLFLEQDAVAPSSMLSPRIQGTNVVMTPRAARRLCDRLVESGVVRELTGRSTFRLYGVGP